MRERYPTLVRLDLLRVSDSRIVLCACRITGGLPAGPDGTNNVYPCTLGMDGHVHICKHVNR